MRSSEIAKHKFAAHRSEIMINVNILPSGEINRGLFPDEMLQNSLSQSAVAEWEKLLSTTLCGYRLLFTWGTDHYILSPFPCSSNPL